MKLITQEPSPESEGTKVTADNSTETHSLSVDSQLASGYIC